MSCFEVWHFVDLSQSKAKCNLCFGIYCKPVVTQCGHKFCNQCIKDWINGRTGECPQCRHQLANKRTRNSVKDYNNLFSKPNQKFIKSLELKYNFVDKECLQVLNLGSIDRHLEECGHNLCLDYNQKLGNKEEHNCLKQLKQELDKQKVVSEKAVNDLKIELNSMNAKIIAQEFSANKSIRICFLKIKS
jgi:hypothetical protein